jgi:Zn-dependent alcohol dehydrogenase
VLTVIIINIIIDIVIDAAVARAPTTPFTVEKINLRDARHDEVLVRVVATGVCHTDVAVKDRNLCAFPIVLGHGMHTRRLYTYDYE